MLYRSIDQEKRETHKLDALTKFHNWIREPLAVENTKKENLAPKWMKVCFIVASNGGWDFKGWGEVTTGTKGHPVGLDQDDAMSLLFYLGFFSGASGTTHIDAFKELQPYFEWYIEHHTSENKKLELVKP